MMKQVFYGKRKIKGAVSVFLVLIFLATYMLSAVLVDGGRYRMAQAMAETALDTAAESVLSYYNQMIYDLYGIFSVDPASVSKEQVAQVLERYVNQTLGTADIDYSGYSTMLSNFILEGEWEAGKAGDYFDDYDFEVNITAGTSVTLASTDYVEDQIIDYMKYRAPLGLAEGVGSFFAKLQAIVNIKDRIGASREQIALTKSHKSLFEKSEKLMNDLNAFNQKVIAYCYNPVDQYGLLFFLESMANGKGEGSQEFNKENAADPYLSFGKALDDRLKEIGNYQESDIPSDFEGGPAPTASPAPDGETDEEDSGEAERLKRYQRQECEKAAEDFAESMQPMFANARLLWEEANTLRDRVTAVNEEYKRYIGEMQSKIDQKPDNEEYKTVYLPEIELAQANCGEILKNIDLLLSSRQFTNDIYTLGNGDDWGNLETVIGGLIDHRLEGGSPVSLEGALDGEGGNWLAETATAYFAQLTGDLQALMSQTSYFYKCHKTEINVRNVDEVKAENEEKDRPNPPADLKAEDLLVNYTSAAAADSGERYSLGGKVNTDEADKLLSAGLSLIDKLQQMLEGVRDNIYVNEYIMTTFPNVVEDRETPEKLTDLEKMRRQYDATYAGVEYILAGNASSGANMVFVDGEILGIRTIFNTVAIFTDSAKRHQAGALAAAISGPFAPVVTIALLVGWAVAESVMDVVELKEGNEVPLFKTGSDWQLSVEGVVEKCIEVIVDKVTGVVNDMLSGVKENLNNKASQVIYEVYNGAAGSMDSAAGAIKSKTAELSASVGELSGSAELGGAMQELNNALSDQVNKVNERVKEWTGEARDKAVKVVNESVDTAFDKVSGRIESELRKLGKDAAENIRKWLPVGKVVNTGEQSAVKLGYTDYLQIFLLMMSQEKKVQRIQSLIQANMIHGGNAGFKMEEAPAAIWADMDCSIRYLFMGNPILPQGVKREGRLVFKVHSARSY